MGLYRILLSLALERAGDLSHLTAIAIPGRSSANRQSSASISRHDAIAAGLLTNRLET